MPGTQTSEYPSTIDVELRRARRTTSVWSSRYGTRVNRPDSAVPSAPPTE